VQSGQRCTGAGAASVIRERSHPFRKARKKGDAGTRGRHQIYRRGFERGEVCSLNKNNRARRPKGKHQPNDRARARRSGQYCEEMRGGRHPAGFGTKIKERGKRGGEFNPSDGSCITTGLQWTHSYREESVRTFFTGSNREKGTLEAPIGQRTPLGVGVRGEQVGGCWHKKAQRKRLLRLRSTLKMGKGNHADGVTVHTPVRQKAFSDPSQKKVLDEEFLGTFVPVVGVEKKK